MLVAFPTRLSEGYAGGNEAAASAATPSSNVHVAIATREPPSAGEGEGEGGALSVAESVAVHEGVGEREGVAPPVRAGVGDDVAGAPRALIKALSTRSAFAVAPNPCSLQQKPAALLAAAGNATV
jgi:hypothetical protein